MIVRVLTEFATQTIGSKQFLVLNAPSLLHSWSRGDSELWAESVSSLSAP